MKAITILQPYAALIALPDDDPRAKRVENRTWSVLYRGDILIHAGKSRARIEKCPYDPESEDEYGLEIRDLAFGAIVAQARLVDCFELDRDGEVPRSALRSRPWLSEHEHVEGPWCWVLAEVRTFPVPIPCKGKQGLWDFPADSLHLGFPS